MNNPFENPSQENVTSENVFETSEPTFDETATKKKDSKKKWIFIIAGIAAAALLVLLIVLIIVAVILFSSGNNYKKYATEKSDYIYSRTNMDGEHFIITMDGKGTVIELGDDIREACLTKDRKNIVILDDDGDLYIADKNGEKKLDIEKDVSDFYIRENGIYFYGENRELYRYYFSKKEAELLIDSKDIENLDSRMFSEGEDLHLAYMMDGDIYLRVKGKDEAEVIGEYDDDNYATLCAVSPDGKVVVWMEEGEKNTTAYLYRKGKDVIEIDSANNEKAEDAYISVYFYNDSKFLVIDSGISDTVFVKDGNKDLVKTRLDDIMIIFDSKDFYGSLDNSDGSVKFTNSMYAVEYESGEYTIYKMNKKGETEKVIDDIEFQTIAGDIIYYSDEDGDIYAGKLSGTKIKKEDKISSKNGSVRNSVKDGKVFVVLYGDDEYDTMGTYKFDKDLEKIEKEYYGSLCETKNGNKIVYLGGDEGDEGGYELIIANANNPDKKEVVDEGVRSIIGSGYKGNIIDENSFYYVKCTGVEEDEWGDWESTYDLYYYNGKESTKVIKDYNW